VIRSRLRGAKAVRSRTYEVTFTGQAGAVLQAEFDDCAISVGPCTTTLRLELADQGALHGLLQRIARSGFSVSQRKSELRDRWLHVVTVVQLARTIHFPRFRFRR
jgi:hypothetical protein